MYNIHYQDKALLTIRSYISLLETYQVERFYDSGLWCEDVIIDGYKNRAKELFQKFRDHIEKQIWGENVFWYRPDPDRPWHASIITSAEWYTLIIDYLEDSENRSGS